MHQIRVCGSIASPFQIKLCGAATSFPVSLGVVLSYSVPMILGFLGKGGSGKSSVATQMTLHLAAAQRTVLAVDADHNMDLSYNLLNGELPSLRFLGDSSLDIMAYAGLNNGERYEALFLTKTLVRFRLSPPDSFTGKYTFPIREGLALMAAGPQTDAVLYGKACSHVLTTPLKVFLPLLQLAEGQAVVVDEKAGADGVSTGIVTGIDVGVIVAEPAIHSIKVALQIAELMDFHETPYVFVGNKVGSDDDEDFLTEKLGQKPVAALAQSDRIRRDPSHHMLEWQASMKAVVAAAEIRIRHDRLARTMKKFHRNEAFSGA